MLKQILTVIGDVVGDAASVNTMLIEAEAPPVGKTSNRSSITMKSSLATGEIESIETVEVDRTRFPVLVSISVTSIKSRVNVNPSLALSDKNRSSGVGQKIGASVVVTTVVVDTISIQK